MNRRHSLAPAILFTFCGLVLSANAIGPGEEALDTTAEEDSRGQLTEGIIFSTGKLRDTFRAQAISTQCHPLDGWVKKSPYQIEYHIKKGDTLRDSLDRLCELSEGLIKWGMFHNCIVIYPVIGDKPEWQTCLDSVISLRLTNATTWEALSALALEVNKNGTVDKRLEVISGTLMGNLPDPEELFTEPCVTVNLRNVTAREAICAIFDASPRVMSYTTSTNDDVDYLYFSCYIEGPIKIGDKVYGWEELALWKKYEELNELGRIEYEKRRAAKAESAATSAP